MDSLAVFFGFLGGSGVTGLLIFFLERYYVEKQRAREYFTRMVLTPGFKKFLGSFYNILFHLDSLRALHQGERSYYFIPEKGEIKDINKLRTLTYQRIEEHKISFQNLINEGVLLFLPQSIYQTILSLDETLDHVLEKLRSGKLDDLKEDEIKKYSTLRKQLKKDIKDILGFSILEESLIQRFKEGIEKS